MLRHDVSPVRFSEKSNCAHRLRLLCGAMRYRFGFREVGLAERIC
jgi:hypothetical protein